MITHVALPIPVRKTFSYVVPDKWVPFIKPLLRVKVPFKNRDAIGFIVGIEEGYAEGLKEIHELIDLFPLLSEKALQLAEWASRYYIAPKGLVLGYALPPGLSIEQYVKIQTLSEIETITLDNLTLRKACKVFGRDVVYEHYNKGFLRLYDTFTNKDFLPSNHEQLNNSGEKTLFIGNIQDRLQYYTEKIAQHIHDDENVLMFVPNHHTVGQFCFDKLSDRFPGKVLRYGISVTARKRMEAYFRARNEGGLIILGSRSCLFLSVFRNGLIIVERPEEDEYRNEKGFRFNAVNLAIGRAEIEHIPVALGSVSPPLELYKRAIDGELHIIEKVYPKKRQYVEVIIEKGISASGSLPEELITLLSRAIESREKVAIYTPRKDYSSHIKCLDCKSLFLCPACGGSLSYQKHRDLLACTGCGRTFPYEARCRQCGSKLIQFSHVGVEYLERSLRELFQGVTIISVTGDSFYENKEAFAKLDYEEPAIIIGTQALTKPYGLTAHKLVMIEWEELMRIGGYRAGEKMFHVLSNLVDVLEPDELYAVMVRRKRIDLEEFFDGKAFCNAELEKRKNAQFPPFVRIFLLEVEKEKELVGIRLVEKIKTAADKHEITQHITGPLMQRRKKYRWRMILKGSEDQLYDFLTTVSDYPGVRVEADPVNI
ncbi:MAG: priA [Deltaproteobacteria bacterium]|nr:priA [Deltaproteobacteria bacterium]